MRIILAVICFLAMLLHAFLGYYLYVEGENIFYPGEVVIAPAEKTDSASVDASKMIEPIKDPKPELPAAESTAPESKPAAKPYRKSKALAVTPLLQAPEPELAHPEFNTGWAGFLQVENAVIATLLFFLGLACCCVSGRGKASRWVFGTSFVFWSFLTFFVWFFHPVNTPLAISKLHFFFPEWYFIIGAAGLSSLLSLLCYVLAFRGKPGYQAVAEKPKKEEMKKAPSSSRRYVEPKKAEPATTPAAKSDDAATAKPPKKDGFFKRLFKSKKAAPTQKKPAVEPAPVKPVEPIKTNVEPEGVKSPAKPTSSDSSDEVAAMATGVAAAVLATSLTKDAQASQQPAEDKAPGEAAADSAPVSTEDSSNEPIILPAPEESPAPAQEETPVEATESQPEPDEVPEAPVETAEAQEPEEAKEASAVESSEAAPDQPEAADDKPAEEGKSPEASESHEEGESSGEGNGDGNSN